jgi:hypothetical protein
MKNYLTIVILLPFFSLAQVGIRTITPTLAELKVEGTIKNLIN